MNLALYIQMALWLAYVLAGYRFFAFISRHALALYCTREAPQGATSSRIRLFMQNLEDEALTGPFRLRITLEPPEPIELDSLVVRAGPKKIREDRTNLHRGTWCVAFDRLPALDTWLFELDAPSTEIKVVVNIESDPNATAAKPKKKVPSLWSNLTAFFPHAGAPLPRLAVTELVLETGAFDGVAGAHATPRFGTLAWVLVLALGAQWLVTWLTLSSIACPELASISGINLGCQLSGSAFPTAEDWYLSVILVAAIVVCFWSGRRNPTPIAQGYLERSEQQH